MQGIFISRCKDQEYKDDGRVEYTYQFPQPGSRWQYETNGFSGRMESLYIRETEWGEVQLIAGFQGPDRVHVLQIPVWHKKHPGKQLSQDFKGFARKVPNFDIDQDFDLGVWMNTAHPNVWTDKSGEKRTTISKYITISQGGSTVKSAFPYVDGQYQGIPEIKSIDVDGELVKSFKAHNDFLIDLVERFSDQNEPVFEARKRDRESTPAEQERETVIASGNSIPDEDVPF